MYQGFFLGYFLLYKKSFLSGEIRTHKISPSDQASEKTCAYQKREMLYFFNNT
jgi:hypothetical protein